MEAKVSISFVLMLGLTMVTSSVFVTGLPVLAKENGSESDGGGESSGSDSGGGNGSGDSGNSDNSGGGSNDNSPHDDKGKDKLEGDTRPKQQEDDGLVHIPEQGWVDGKWTGGTEEMFNRGPNGNGIIPSGCSHGGCVPHVNDQLPPKQPPTLIQEINIILNIHKTSHSSHKTGISSACYDALKVAWMGKVYRGQNQQVDQFLNSCLEVKS